MNRYRTRLTPACVSLVVAALALAAGAEGQQSSLRQGVVLANLRFIGVEAALPVETLLGADDAALLVSAKDVRSLNFFIRGGLPVRSARIQQLIDWGLLRQEGAGFRTVVPILSGETAVELARLVEEALPVVAAETAPQIQRIADRVWRHPGVPTLPAVTAWLLRDRVWEHLSGPNGIDFRRRVAEQQANYPERGFWGVLWYAAEPTAPAYDFREWRRGEYTIQVAWNQGDGDPTFGADDGPVPMTEILGKLEDRGRKLDDSDDFPGARAAGLVDSDGRSRIGAFDYRVANRDTLAYVAEEVAVAIAESVLRNVPRTAIADLLGVSSEMATVIAYTELAPRLVASLADKGMLVRPDDQRAEWRTAAEAATAPSGRPERATVASDDGSVAVPESLPDYSAVIWRDLPRRSEIRIVWW